MVDGHFVVHGVLVFSPADTALPCAGNGFGPAAVTAGADMAFVRPASLGDDFPGGSRDAVPARPQPPSRLS